VPYEREGQFCTFERVLKRIQKKHSHFNLIKRRDENEKELKVKNENRGS
jgi:hypothetical protein